MVGEDGEMTMMSGDLWWCHVVDLVSVHFTVLQYYQGIKMVNIYNRLAVLTICTIIDERPYAAGLVAREWKKRKMHRIFPCREPKPDVIVI